MPIENKYEDLEYLKWILEEEFGVSSETVRMVTAINGENIESYEDMLYVATGYHHFSAFMEEMVD